ITSNAFHGRAALPVPPYTTKSAGRSATSGSRLLHSMRNAASCTHPLQESSAPRAARTVRAPSTMPYFYHHSRRGGLRREDVRPRLPKSENQQLRAPLTEWGAWRFVLGSGWLCRSRFSRGVAQAPLGPAFATTTMAVTPKQ